MKTLLQQAIENLEAKLIEVKGDKIAEKFFSDKIAEYKKLQS